MSIEKGTFLSNLLERDYRWKCLRPYAKTLSSRLSTTPVEGVITAIVSSSAVKSKAVCGGSSLCTKSTSLGGSRYGGGGGGGGGFFLSGRNSFRGNGLGGRPRSSSVTATSFSYRPTSSPTTALDENSRSSCMNGSRTLFRTLQLLLLLLFLSSFPPPMNVAGHLDTTVDTLLLVSSDPDSPW